MHGLWTWAQDMGSLLSWVAALLILLALALLVLAYFYFLRKMKGQELPADLKSAAEAFRVLTLQTSMHLRRSFARAIKVLRENVVGPHYRYRVPWFLVIGPAGAGKSTLLGETGLQLPLGRPPPELPGLKEPVRWWFFDGGVALDLAGELVLREDGMPGDNRTWSIVLDMLQRYRPRRPLDGIILTIPATDLVGPAALPLDVIGRRADVLYASLHDVHVKLGLRLPIYVLITKCDTLPGFTELSAMLPGRLRRDAFGWSTPYALEAAYNKSWMTEAFAGIHQRLGALQFDILADRPPGKGNDGSFVFAAALRNVEAGASTIVNHLFRESAYRDHLFFRGIYFCGDGGGEGSHAAAARDTDFDSGAASVPAGLKLPKILTEPGPALEEDGAVTARMEPSLGTTSRPAPLPGGQVFLERLFIDKIFEERGLSRPAGRTLFARNRAVRVAQAALVLVLLLGGFNQAWSYIRLERSRAVLLPAVEQVRDALAEMDKVHRAGAGEIPGGQSAAARHEVEQRATALLNQFARLDTETFASLFMPISYLSPLRRDIARAFSRAFERIIFTSLDYEFIHRAQLITSEASLQTGNTAGDGTSLSFLDSDPAFRELTSYVKALDKLQQNFQTYKSLPQTLDLKALSGVVSYLFRIDLPPTFFSGARLYRIALGRMDTTGLKFFPGDYQGAAQAKLANLRDVLFTELFQNNPIQQRAGTLAQTLDAAFAITDSSAAASGYTQLIDAANRTEAALRSSTLDWVGGSRLNLGPAYAALLQEIGNSSLLGEDAARQFDRRAVQGFRALQAALPQVASQRFGPVLQRQNGTGPFELAPIVVTLRASLQELLGRRFMGPASVTAAARLSLPGPIVWDADVLADTASLGNEYGDFLDGGLNNFPPAARLSVSRVTLERYKASVLDHLARAEQPVLQAPGGLSAAMRSESQLRSDVRSFQLAAPSLIQILGQLDQYNTPSVATLLSGLTIQQAFGLLARVDQLLDRGNYYAPVDASFTGWQGGPGAGYAAYLQSDSVSMATYLDAQSSRVDSLALDLAKPLVDFLAAQNPDQPGLDTSLLARWQRIIAEVQKRAQRNPASAETQLENFLLFDLNKITLADCQARTASTLSPRSGDYFVERKSAVLRALEARCSALIGQHIASGYQGLEVAFNNNLAGRPPFADPSIDPPGPAADPDAVRDFFALFDAQAPTVKANLGKLATTRAAEARALRFIQQLEQTEKFLAPFLKGPLDQPPTYDLAIKFRVNQQNEQGASDILDWQAAVGPKNIDFRDADQTAKWQLGQPILVTLQWAKNAPVRPALDPAQPNLKVQDEYATFLYDDRWALLSLLRQQGVAAGEIAKSASSQPIILGFTVPLTPANTSAVSVYAQNTGPAKLFVRFAVTGQVNGKPVALTLPPFPRVAPSLGASTAQAN
jgi:type VI secretion system protein ImpL